MVRSFGAWLRSQRSSVVVLGFFVLVRSTFANEYVVPSGSMEPTIAIGDRIFVNRIAYDLKIPFSHASLARMGEPARGQIVVFESPVEPGLVLVKRLVAVPGDEVEIRDGFVFLNGRATTIFGSGDPETNDGVAMTNDGAAVTINDGVDANATQLPREYFETIGSHHHRVQRLPEMFRPDHFHFVVSEGHYFMMGDNRDNSADGRYFGFVTRELLIGEATRVLFSVDFSKRALDMVAWERFGQGLE